jgi:hypothetical protein
VEFGRTGGGVIDKREETLGVTVGHVDRLARLLSGCNCGEAGSSGGFKHCSRGGKRGKSGNRGRQAEWGGPL